MSKLNSYDSKSSSFNTLDRELSIKNNHTDKNIITSSPNKIKEMSIQSNQIKSNKLSKHIKLPINKSPIITNNKIESELNRESIEKKIKYIDIPNKNFVDYYSKGNNGGYNYNTEQDNNLRFSESTRRNTLPKTTLNIYKNSSRDTSLDNLSANNKLITNLVDIDSNLRLKTLNSDDNIMSINSNLIIDIAAKVSKESSEYWDNTKRRNLDTAIYTNNPQKIQGRGFGDIDSYDLFKNGVGTSTRQDSPDSKPQNKDDDRIFLTNHNYNYDKHHITENLSCGTDTRYLNKKML
jgi:hypothetical protein